MHTFLQCSIQPRRIRSVSLPPTQAWVLTWGIKSPPPPCYMSQLHKSKLMKLFVSLKNNPSPPSHSSYVTFSHNKHLRHNLFQFLYFDINFYDKCFITCNYMVIKAKLSFMLGLTFFYEDPFKLLVL